MKEVLKKFSGKKIVVDTRSSWVYIGVLEKVGDNHIQVKGVDVHDNSDFTASKEQYIWESSRTGIKSNRETVYINLDYVVSFSPLETVKQF